MHFSARTVTGSGRGKELGTPTVNLHLLDIPASLQEGIHACIATIDGHSRHAVMHYGPRPVFQDIPSCEIHLLDTFLERPPERLDIDVIGFLRPVRDFPSVDALLAQIARDRDDARAMLQMHDDEHSPSTDSR